MEEVGGCALLVVTAPVGGQVAIAVEQIVDVVHNGQMPKNLLVVTLVVEHPTELEGTHSVGAGGDVGVAEHGKVLVLQTVDVVQRGKIPKNLLVVIFVFEQEDVTEALQGAAVVSASAPDINATAKKSA